MKHEQGKWYIQRALLKQLTKQLNNKDTMLLGMSEEAHVCYLPHQELVMESSLGFSASLSST